MDDRLDALRHHDRLNRERLYRQAIVTAQDRDITRGIRTNPEKMR